MEVSIREFRANLSKYLKEDEVKITSNGEVVGVYTKIIKACTQSPKKTKSVYTAPIMKTIEDVVKKMAEVKENPKFLTYGCGCKKGESTTCPKHHRI